MARLSPRFLCIPFLVLLAVAASLAHGEQGPDSAAKSAPTLVVEGLGKATVTLSGPWQFHLGDEAGWEQPGLDDSTGHNGWETIRAACRRIMRTRDLRGTGGTSTSSLLRVRLRILHCLFFHRKDRMRCIGTDG